jgi:hypothetical protein
MNAETEKRDNTVRVAGVAEAAAHFGISTLRVRHRLRTGMLRGFRDNRGHWQVYLDDAPATSEDRPLDGQALTDMLTEEVLEAKDRIEDQDVAIKRLHVIVERQQRLLERLIARFESVGSGDADPETIERVRRTLDRLLTLLETSLQQHEAANARAERFRAMMERAIQLLESVEPSLRETSAEGLKLVSAIDQAMDLGDRAMRQAELSTSHAARLDNMLDRALAIAETNVETHKLTEERLKSRDELLERSFNLIETASTRLQGGRAKTGSWFGLFPRRSS